MAGVLTAIGFAAAAGEDEEVIFHGPDCDIYIYISSLTESNMACEQ